METTKNLGSVNAKRRELMVAGLAGASALLVGEGGSALAQTIEEKGKVERKALKPVDSMIPGFPKVRLREVTYEPGANTKAKMQNAMVCQCTQGSLEVSQDGGKTFTAKTGDIWTCKLGIIEANANKGNTPATMRVIDLLTA